MRVVIVLVLLVAFAAAQKRKEEPEYDDDYDYDNDAPVKDTKKDIKDTKAKPSSGGIPASADSSKNDDQDAEKPVKKLEHPTSLFLKPRNTRVQHKVTPAPGQRNKPTLPSFIKNPATGGQVSTTVTPRPPGGFRAERTTAAPISRSNTKSSRSTTTTTQKPRRGASSSSSSTSSKKNSRTTEAPANDGRRFGSNTSSKSKSSKSSRFNNKEKDN